MTHCEGYGAAAVARSDDRRHRVRCQAAWSLPAETLELLLRDDERAALRTLADAGAHS